MYISRVISYGDAWNSFVTNYRAEKRDIEYAIAGLSFENIEKAGPMPPGLSASFPARLRGYWDTIMRSRRWHPAHELLGLERRVLRNLGYVKKNVSVSLIRTGELFNQWLFTAVPIAFKSSIVQLPICIGITSKVDVALFKRQLFMGSVGVEHAIDDLIALSPLSHRNPFLILVIQPEKTQLSFIEDDNEVSLTELPAESGVNARQIIINRAIEFPPEYHQAGLGILSYFGTVLREKYPDEKATVRIEQDGLIVRLIVESGTGNKEIIEKALQEYQLVVRGISPPESLFESPLKIIELKSELRIAHVRIESQKDLIEHQNLELATFHQLLDHALTRGSSSGHPMITVSPTINMQHVKCAVTINRSEEQFRGRA